MAPADRSRSRVRLTARDLELLGFAAEHRQVLPDHVAALLGVSVETASARLRALAQAGLLAREQPFRRERACYRVQAPGLAAIDSDLRAPRRLDLRFYEHEVGAAWLWLAAGAGRFGDLREVVGERRMRSADSRPEREGLPFGVRLGGAGPRGRERLHYPDLLLIAPDGRRIAVELELSSKGRRRRERILAGYGAEARISAVLYLVRDRRIGRSVQDSARRLGLGELIHVQQIRLAAGPTREAAASTAERSPARNLQPGGPGR